jgi:uncharacterized protein YndB with AHSA1/START domain
MKTLKFTIIILAFVLGAFASIGLLQPTVKYGVSVNTSRNHMTTWKVMASDDLMSEWIEGFKSIKLIEGELNTLGSRYEVVIEDHGEDYTMMETVTAVEKGKRLSLSIENESLITNMDIIFEPSSDGGTKVTTHNVAEGKAWFVRSMFVFMKGSFQEQEEKHYNAFAELVDRSDIDVYLNEQE